MTIRADTSGLTSDVQDVIPGVEGAMQDMVSNVNTAFAGINIAGPMQDAMGDLPDAIPDAMGDAKDALEKADLPNPVAPVVEGVRASGAEISQLLQGLIVKAKGLMAMVGISWGISTLIGMAKTATAAAEESINTQLRLRGLLEATGNTTGYTANQLVRMSQELRDSMNTSAGSIQGVMIRLSMFGSLSDEVFEKAVKASINLAKVTGMAPESVARMIGSALENPAAGLGRLKWMGISLNKEQKEQIKNYVESGEKLKATVMLMEIIDGKSADVAEKIAKTPTGQLDALRLKLELMRKELGVQLIPTALVFAEVAVKIQGAFNQLIGGVGATIEWFNSWGVTVWGVIKSLSYLVVVSSSYWVGVKVALGVLWAYHKVMWALHNIQKLYNVSVMIGRAMTPGGWIGIAAGIALATGAFLAMNSMMSAAEAGVNKVSNSFKGLNAEIKGVRQASEEWQKTMEKNRYGSRMPGKEDLKEVMDIANDGSFWNVMGQATELMQKKLQLGKQFVDLQKAFSEDLTKNLEIITPEQAVNIDNARKAVERLKKATEELTIRPTKETREAYDKMWEEYEKALKKANYLTKEGKDKEAEDAGKTERSVRMAFPELSNQIQDAIMKKGASDPVRTAIQDLDKHQQDGVNKTVAAIDKNKNAPVAVLSQG